MDRLIFTYLHFFFFLIVLPKSLIFGLGKLCFLSKNISSLEEMGNKDLVWLGLKLISSSL